MVIGIIGESCTGKSTFADKLKSLLDAKVYTGKDYLHLAKNEAIAQTFCLDLDVIEWEQRKWYDEETDDSLSGGDDAHCLRAR